MNHPRPASNGHDPINLQGSTTMNSRYWLGAAMAAVVCSLTWAQHGQGVGPDRGRPGRIAAPLLRDVFGQPRSEQEDLIVLRNGETVRGAWLDQTVTIVTAYGAVVVPTARIAGIGFGAGDGRPDTILTVNCNRLTGTILERHFQVRGAASRNRSRDMVPLAGRPRPQSRDDLIRQEEIATVARRLTRDEAAFVDRDAILLVMGNGDLLTGALEEDSLVTTGPMMRTRLADLAEAVFTPNPRGAVLAELTLRTGARLRGPLVTETLTLKLDAGPTVDAVWQTRLGRLVTVDGYRRAWEACGLPVPPLEPPRPRLPPPVVQGTRLTVTLPGGIPMVFRQAPAGRFQMGSPTSEKTRGSDEGPVHQVTVTRPFWIGAHEVTQAQWTALMDRNPAVFKGADRPIENITFDDAQGFVNRLNELGIGTFRLPTEAEWEYAARAGTQTQFPWGDDPGFDQVDEHGWYGKNSRGQTHPVGQKKPNAWGLYDMLGNVYEWCGDRYGKYAAAPQVDPQGPAKGGERVMRGGAYDRAARLLRPANRSSRAPAADNPAIGMRLVVELPR
jgi:formylglycine-generating enzyme required for sulfatase activity